MALTSWLVTLVVTLVQFSEPERYLNKFHSLFSKGSLAVAVTEVLVLHLLTV